MSPREIAEKIRAFAASLTAEDAGLRFEFAEDAAGNTVEIQCAKPGRFKVQGGKKVSLSESDLVGLAGSLDPADDHLLKVGHKEIETDTPDFGRVTGLRYDGESKRLLAAVVPTPAGVRKNREEGFRYVSMEIRKPRSGNLIFDHLSLLAAHRPAIRDLEPVAFAEGEEIPDGMRLCFSDGGDGEDGDLIVFRDFNTAERKKAAKEGAAMPDGSFPIMNESDLMNAMHAIGRAKDPAAAKAHIKKRAKALGLMAKLTPAFGGDAEDAGDNGADEKDESKMSAPNSGSDLRKESEMADTEKLALEADKAAAEKRAKEADERLTAFAEGDARRFLAGNTEKIGLAARQAGVEALLVRLAGMQATSGEKIKFSAEGKDVELGVYDLACRVLLAGPAQLTEEQKRETAKNGTAVDGEEPPKLAFGAATTPDGNVRYLAVQRKINEAGKKGVKLSFAQAAEALAREAQ